MRKFSYLFAALLMSVLSLTSKAGTTVEDFSLFSLSGLELQCPEGWSYINGSAGSITMENQGLPGVTAIFYGSSSSPYTKYGYLVTEAKAGTISLEVAIPVPIAAAASGAYVSVSTMGGASGPVGTELKKWTVDNELSNALCTFVTVEVELPADGYIGITGKNICIKKYTNTYEGGGGGGADEWIVADSQDFNTIQSGYVNATTTGCPQMAGWPDGWFYITNNANYNLQQQGYGGVDDSVCMKFNNNMNAQSVGQLNNNSCVLITYAHKGKVTLQIKAASTTYASTDARGYIVLYQMNQTGDTFTVGNTIKAYANLKEASADISASSFVPVTFDVPEDCYIGITGANVYIDNYVNSYEVAGGNFTLSGTVKTQDGTPIVGATVKLTGCEDVTTAEDGSFSFADAPSGTASLRVTANGYISFSEEINITSDMTKDVVLLQQTSVLKLYFYTSTNAAHIMTGTFTLYEGETETPVADNENVTADQDGWYIFTIKGALNPDNYTLKGSAPGYEPLDMIVYSDTKYNEKYFVIGQTLEQSKMLTPKKVNFTATVVNAEQEYVESAKVTLTYGATSRDARYVADSQTYVIPDLPAPELAANTVVASCVVGGMKPIPDQTIDFNNENITVTFVAVPYDNTVIKGTVSSSEDEEVILEGATVALYDGENKVQETTTDAEGAYKFTLNGKTAETYTITATAPYYTDYSAEITPEEEAINTVNVAMTPVMYGFSATVADEDNAAIEGAKVTLGGKELTTDEHGNFVGSVWAGDVAGGKSIEVVASAEGYDPETFELTYAEGETEASHAFILKLTQYSLTVTVTEDINYETLPDAIVKVFDADGAEQTVVNEGNGVFGANWTSKTVPAGELTVTVMCEGYDSKSETFDFSSDKDVSIDVELTEHLYSLTVTVLNSNDNDAPVLDATVVITCEELEEVREEADPQGDGTYVFQAGAVSAKGLTLIATITAPGLENPVSFNFNFDDGNVDKTVKIAVSGVNAVFAGEKGAKNLAGKIYVNGDAEIFSIDGKLVRVVRTQGVEEIEGLQPGLYIVAGQKMIVK